MERVEFSESQLLAWTAQGATVGSANTYASIKNALDVYEGWPDGLTYSPYLQGSYANSTNIRGNSDVDVVVEMDSAQYSNLNDAEKKILNLTPAKYDYSNMRRHVIQALTDYYGAAYVDCRGSKSIKLKESNGRLPADVVPAVTYRHYSQLKVVAEGIKFVDQKTNGSIYNYPKLHITNGEIKNRRERTAGRYKPTVRMFKNIRDYIVDGSALDQKVFPSYFVECLLSNVTDECFRPTYQETVLWIVRFLGTALRDGTHTTFVTQSGRHTLIGTNQTQWPEENARQFIIRLLDCCCD